MSNTAPDRRAHSGSGAGAPLAAASAVVLLTSMFVLQWYGITSAKAPFGPGSAASGSVSAWRALTGLRWLMLLTIAVALGAMLLRWRRGERPARVDVSWLVAGLGSATALLLVYRVLIDLPSPSSIVDQKLGAPLGLLGAVGIALGGYQSWREAREAGVPSPSRARA